MSKARTLRALVNERLAAAAEEIFALFERTIADYEEELCRCKGENQRTPQLRDSPLSLRIALVTGAAQMPPTATGPWVNENSTQSLSPTPRVKEEPEEWNVKQEEEQLPVNVPNPSVVCVKTEETSVLQQRHTKHKEEDQGEDISLEPHFSVETECSLDTDNDDEWGAPVSFSTLQMETETDGVQYNQVQIGGAQTFSGPSLEHSSVPEKSGIENDRDMSGTDNNVEGKNHQCYVCQKRFGTKQILNRHIKIHTGEKVNSCPFCDKTFVQKYTLDIHMRTHTGEKPFSCSLCERKYADSSNLKTHMRVAHTGDTPFSCSFCDKGFCFSSDLQAHMRSHTREKPFSCSICTKTFTCNSSLSKHMRIHADTKPFSCSICEKTFTQKINLQVHMCTHMEEKPFYCSVCQKAYVRQAQLERHMKTHSGTDPAANQNLVQTKQGDGP